MKWNLIPTGCRTGNCMQYGTGDFTTTGHFILIRGYGKDGFYVNDPNHKSNSEKTWSFKELQKQIKCLWALA